MTGKPKINTDSVRRLARSYVLMAEDDGVPVPGGRLVRDTIPGLCDEIDHLRQECRDRERTEQDVRARLADAENALARVRALADLIDRHTEREPDAADFRHADTGVWHDVADEIRAALGGKP